MYHCDAIDLLRGLDDESVDLVLTSPPFALAAPKEYGNEIESKYVEWFLAFAHEMHRVLRPSGSFVLDLGGAWLPGSPTKSLYQWRLLIELVDTVGFHLAQDFYWYNTAKLPSPAQWVTVNRWRAKDAVNTVWWLSKTESPKSDNRRVLVPYSKSMQRLLKRGSYNSGVRPGGQHVGQNWATDHGGAIAPNVIRVEGEAAGVPDRITENDEALAEIFGYQDLLNVLEIANTRSSGDYHEYCKANNLKRHPARFPEQLPEFFIKFLTDPGDTVVDPFAGSNATGFVAESLQRRWIASELDYAYIKGSRGRFRQ